MKPEDAGAGVALLRDCFRELDPTASLFAADASERLVELYKRVEAESGKALIAHTKSPDKSGVPVALLMFRVERRPLRRISEAIQIDVAYVKPGLRKQGMMRSMLEQMHAWADRKGIDAVELGTPAGLNHSLEFWKNQGFAPIFTTLRRAVHALDKPD